jgi:hypothetical protein
MQSTIQASPRKTDHGASTSGGKVAMHARPRSQTGALPVTVIHESIALHKSVNIQRGQIPVSKAVRMKIGQNQATCIRADCRG